MGEMNNAKTKGIMGRGRRERMKDKTNLDDVIMQSAKKGTEARKSVVRRDKLERKWKHRAGRKKCSFAYIVLDVKCINLYPSYHGNVCYSFKKSLPARNMKV